MNKHNVSPRVVVVGGCASGKTSLVEALRAHGLDAVVSAQEHSEIPTLWTRSRPDVLIVLYADLETVRKRRGEHWPEAVFDAQQVRLQHAKSAADLVLDTGELALDQVIERVLDHLASRAA